MLQKGDTCVLSVCYLCKRNTLCTLSAPGALQMMHGVASVVNSENRKAVGELTPSQRTQVS